VNYTAKNLPEEPREVFVHVRGAERNSMAADCSISRAGSQHEEGDDREKAVGQREKNAGQRKKRSQARPQNDAAHDVLSSNHE
jgi:hypothetical protein